MSLSAAKADCNAAAVDYTVIETAKLNDVDPNGWLADTIPRIPDFKFAKVDGQLA